jgi:flagellin
MEAELGTDFSFQVGAKTAAPNQISIKINGMGSHALGLKADPADPAPAAPADYLVRQATVSGAGVVTANNGNTSITLEGLGAGAKGAQADVTYTTTDPASVNAAAAAINAGTATTNIVATVGADGSGNAGKIVLTHNGESVAGLGAHADLAKLQGLVAFDTANTVPFATMQVSGSTGILTFDKDATAITLVLGKTTTTGAAGAKSSITIDATANLQTAVDAINGAGTPPGGTAEHGYTASIVAAPGGGSLAGTIKLVQGSAGSGITQTALADFIDNGANGIGAIAKQQPAAAGPTQDMDVKTLSKALEAIVAVDSAIKTVNIQRSTLGAVSNRLSHTINNLTNISTNLSAAQGGIEDADFAHETTMLAKNQILQQASTAMLAQANASKQNVLSLLQG